MTTKNIIKALPINDKLKLQILNTFDYMEPAQRFTITQIAWKTYDQLFQERLELNLQMQHMDVLNEKDHLGEDFYSRALKRTEEEITADFQEAMAKTDIAAARQAMEQIVKEIQATTPSKRGN